MSRVVTVARTDIADAFRSNTLWAAIGFMIVLVSALWLTIGSNYVEMATNPFLLFVAQFQDWLPLIAIVIGYNSVVGERESGRIRVLLGLSGTRRDVVFGKFLSRSIVLLLAISVALILSTGLVIYRAGSIGLLEVVSGTLVLFLYGLAWMGAAVGVSSFVASRTRTISIMVGLYALFGPLWTLLGRPLLTFAITGSTTVPVDTTRPLALIDEPTWYLYANRLSLTESFSGAVQYVPDLFEVLFFGASTNAPHAPNLFGLGVLLTWSVLPVLIGYWRFERAELG